MRCFQEVLIFVVADISEAAQSAWNEAFDRTLKVFSKVMSS